MKGLHDLGLGLGLGFTDAWGYGARVRASEQADSLAYILALILCKTFIKSQ